MMDPRLRVSDADRERVVTTLRHHVGEGRLSLDEFSERCARAYAARTAGDLDALTSDLPRGAPMPRAAARMAPPAARRLWPAAFVAAVVAMSGFATMATAGGSMLGGMCP